MNTRITQFTRRLIAACFAGAVCTCLQAPAAQWVTWDVGSGGNGHQYLAVPGFAGLTWDMANTLAQQQGGYLASITSAAENDFVFSLINSSSFFNSFNGAGPCIGGYQYDALDEPAGHWAWTSGEPWSYTNWAPGLPNNFPPGQQNLVYYSGQPSTPAKTWDDVVGSDPGPPGYGMGGYVVEMVPEPSSFALIGCAGVLLMGRVASRRK